MPLLNPIRKTLKRLFPGWILGKIRPFGHGLESLIFHYYYGRPSDKLVVIGVTGTKGKTSTAHVTYQLLNYLGCRCGIISTAMIDSGQGEELNQFRMTQMSGAVTHSLLARMVKAGYKYAVIEVSSEGLAQKRHTGINFDIAVFTNLTPDHIEAHGSFENYKHAKGILFKELASHVITRTKKSIVPSLQKTIITNADSEHSAYFALFAAPNKISYGVNGGDVCGQLVTDSPTCIVLKIEKITAHINILGKFNVYNVLAAVAVTKALGLDEKLDVKALEQLRTIPGRMELLQTMPFMVLVDYAHEKASMAALYDAVKQWPHDKIIQVLGATGGVRDKSRRTDLGKMAGEFMDICVITDEDPFDEDPQVIIHDIADAAVATGKKTIGENLFRNPNRKEAIAKALSLAKAGDLVLITGKGAEQKIARANGTYEDWDDRVVVREELEKLSIKNSMVPHLVIPNK